MIDCSAASPTKTAGKQTDVKGYHTHKELLCVRFFLKIQSRKRSNSTHLNLIVDSKEKVTCVAINHSSAFADWSSCVGKIDLVRKQL